MKGCDCLISKQVIVNDEMGLHTRHATFFIQRANEFRSTILVEIGNRRVNAKSLLGVLSLAIDKSTKITLIIDGSDEKQAMDSLVEFLESEAEFE